MNVSVELILSIALALTLPLLGAIAAFLFQIKSDMKSMSETMERFAQTFEKVDKSLDHNRNEHTQLVALCEAILESNNHSQKHIEDKIEILGAQIKS